MFFLEKIKKINFFEKISFLIVNYIKITIFLAVPISVYEKNWMTLFVATVALFLLFLPNFLEKRYQINLPKEFQIVIVIFIYLSLFLGEVKSYYVKLWWWDSLLHAFSGIALGFVGFLILYVFYKTGKFKGNLKIIFLFSFCFAVALGVLWEIFEFGVDSFYGSNMQRARCLENFYLCNTRLGVLDTMRDLILNSLGAFFASLTGYFYIKKKEFPIFAGLVEAFEEKNPDLFKKRKKKID